MNCISMWSRTATLQWSRKISPLLRYFTTPNFYDSTIEKYASVPIKKLSLPQMLTIGRLALEDNAVLFKHARFVQTELPKRLARRLLDLRFLPHVIITNPHIQRVYDAYYKAFNIFLGLQEIRTTEQNTSFTQILKELLEEQAPMLDMLAAGLRECLVRKSLSEKIDLQPFLESMLRSRISRRVIAEHHIGLHDRRKGFIGCVCTDLSVQEVISSAANRAQSVCRENYGRAPAVQVISSRPVSMPYIPVHLDYMLYELLKNSMRAVMESTTNGFAEIQAKICESVSDVTIRISDEGGGIKQEYLNEIWNYGFSTTTNNQKSQSESFMLNSHSSGAQSKLYGYGFGLPFSRLHARYFGGDLQLVSVPGYGVDTFLTTKKLHKQDWYEGEVDLNSSERLVYTGKEDHRDMMSVDRSVVDRIFS